MFEHHVRNQLFLGDAGLADWHLDFAAHMVQRPFERPSVGSILRSDAKGTGKDIYTEVLCGLLRPENWFRTADLRNILGRFNKHLAPCLIVTGEETTYAPDKAQAEKLKGMVSMETLPFEPKGVDITQLPFFGRLFFTSNQLDPLLIESGDRRYTVSNVPEHENTQNTRWFGEMFRQMREAGGYAGLLGYLMDRDISGFDPRSPYDTQAKRETVRRQMPHIDQWIVRVIEETEDTCEPPDLEVWKPKARSQWTGEYDSGPEEEEDKHAWRNRGRFYDLYCASARHAGQRPVSAQHLKSRLHELGFADRREGPEEDRGPYKWNFYSTSAREGAKRSWKCCTERCLSP